jgi:hypothetical protein
MVKTLITGFVVATTLGASSQTQAQLQVDPGNPTQTFRINVVSRKTPAASYRLSPDE